MMCSEDHAARGRHRLSGSQRLKSDREIREAYAQGRRWVGRCMVLWLRSAADGSLRLAVVSSRKVGNAVERNKARRRLREAFRLNRWRLSGDCDIVIVARRGILKASADEVERELLYLALKAGIYRESEK
jgi:ribonuclease P protein component